MIKQVIIIRRDLKMRRGKEISQGSHASMMWLCDRIKSNLQFSEEESEWLNGIFTKITLQIDSESELLNIYNKAKEKSLTAYLVTDSGKTEFGGIPTITALAIGPHEATRIDEITSELKLY